MVNVGKKFSDVAFEYPTSTGVIYAYLKKRNSPDNCQGSMKRVAASETVIVVEVIVDPVEVQNPADAIPVEVRDEEVAVGSALKYAIYLP